ASDARVDAVRRFGGVDQAKEACRDVPKSRPIEELLRDLRYGLRILNKDRWFTALAVLTLALGIGANTAVFSVIYGVLIRPLPYHNGNQLVFIRQTAPLAHVDDLSFSVKDITDFREQNHTLDALVEYHTMSFILYGRKEPERVQTSVVSANFFDVLGVTPLLGRTFLPSDDQPGSDAVLVLTNEYWQRSFHGDQSIVGKRFQLNDRPHTVIGVLPPIPQYPAKCDVYMPTSHCPYRASAQFIADRGSRMMNVFGRLKTGVPIEQARADLATIASNLQKEYPDFYPPNSGYTTRVTSLHQELTQRARPTLLILLATAVLVLLIACANVANLSLARLMRRDQEIALRAALGAGRGRLIRQLLTESMLLAAVGGVAGLIFAEGTLGLLVRFAEKLTNRAGEIRIDGGVLLFTLIVSLGTGLVFGLFPALSSQRNLASTVNESSGRATSGTGRRRIRSLLIVAQVAVSFVLLIGAGLMLRSLTKLKSVNPGFDPENVLVMRISHNFTKYDTADKLRQVEHRLAEQIKTEPGVLSAAIATTFPLNPSGITFGPNLNDFVIEGRPRDDGKPKPVADLRTVSPDYFRTVRVPVVKGRTFTEMDGKDGQHVVVINQSLARHRWPDEDPIGKRISGDNGKTWATIVGIVGDVHQYGVDQAPTDEAYTPLEQNPGAGILLVRTATDPMSLAGTIREAVHTVDSETAVDRVETLDQARSDSIATPRVTSFLLALFAGLALVITAAGIGGVMALSVTQRTHEMGIRMALGATAGEVMAMVVRQGMALVLAGVVIGIAGALGLGQLMSSLLFSVPPTDAETFIMVSIALLGVATLSCIVPARRVTGIDPINSLRFE
ncbi:MAG TPA: ABC transporter permease, partial [Blastocatellia bacterium]|nr:ABC transporter permease [Blastocatellia bacterium]